MGDIFKKLFILTIFGVGRDARIIDRVAKINLLKKTQN
jgi:hypothetical protein